MSQKVTLHKDNEVGLMLYDGWSLLPFSEACAAVVPLGGRAHNARIHSLFRNGVSVIQVCAVRPGMSFTRCPDMLRSADSVVSTAQPSVFSSMGS